MRAALAATLGGSDQPLLRRMLGEIWHRLGLARQFALAGFTVSLLGVFVLGSWVSRQIETNVIDNAGAATAVSLSHFIAPHLQELASHSTLSPQTIDALDRVTANPIVKPRIEYMKVWLHNGQLAYSTTRSQIGRVFPLDDALRRAWNGAVAAELDNHPDEEGTEDPAKDASLLEVNAPIHEEATGEVIAVVEFYQRAEEIKERLARAKWQSWLVTAVLAMVMIGSLFTIVADGSRTIDRQRVALTQRIAELSGLLQQNRTLRDRVERGARQAAEDYERFLRETGSELHDGPAQLISLALLRLDAVPLPRDGDAPIVVRGALSDALEAIRNVCSGLLLPESEHASLSEAVRATIRDHERRTGTRVAWFGGELPADVPDYIKLCVCRFIQEGLTNAFRHAGGKGQRVAVRWEGRAIAAEVSDEGPGLFVRADAPENRRLGLLGLRGRIESIGGTMAVSSPPGEGTRLVMRLPVKLGGGDGA